MAASAVFSNTVGPTGKTGKTEVGPTKYLATSDLQSGYFFGQFCFLVLFFLVSQGENRPLTTYCLGKFLLVW